MLLRCLKLYPLRSTTWRPQVPLYRRYESSAANIKKSSGPVFHEEPLGYPADNGYGFLNIDIGEPIGGKGRYITVRKLGYGAYSSVWLAKDTQPLPGEPAFVAVKALTQHASQLARSGEIDELKLMQTISWAKSFCGGRAHCVRFIEADLHFMPGEDVPNICIASEVLGQDVLTFRQRYTDRALPLEMTKTITRHVLKALAHLHANGIAHTDIKIDNIALSSTYSDSEIEHILETDKPRYYPTQDVFGKVVKPLVSQPLPFPREIPEGGYIFKLSDFGHSHWLKREGQPKIDGLGTRTVRAPEVILNRSWNEKVDIWGLGCLVCEFLTGKPLFDPKEGPDYPADIHHLSLILRSRDEAFRNKVQESERKSDAMREAFGLLEKADASGQNGNSMRVRLQVKLDDETLESTLHFLRRCLAFSPNDRAAAQELLDDPWLIP